MEPAGSPGIAPAAAQPAGRVGRERSPGSVTQLTACLPAFGCVEPIRKSSFLSLQNTTHPLLCSPLCPPGPVSRTAAVSGADGLGACERTTCSQCSLLPSSRPPTSSSPASSCSHIKPRFSLCSSLAGTLRGARFHTTGCGGLTASVWGLLSLPCFSYKASFSSDPPASLPPNSPLSLWTKGSLMVTQRRGRGLHAGQVPNSQVVAKPLL